MAEILHLVNIKTSPQRVYAALTEEEGLSNWWTEQTHAEPKVGTVATFRFGNHSGSDMQIVELKKNRLVHWRCVAHLSGGEWINTEVFFELKADGKVTTVLFSHRRWLEATEFLRYCSAKWAVFLVSLKNYVEKGTGSPYPRDIDIG